MIGKDKKICSKCKIEKHISEFRQRLGRLQGCGLSSHCKSCISIHGILKTKLRRQNSLIKPLDIVLEDIPGYEGLYAITEDGRVWRYPRFTIGGRYGGWVKYSISHHGYKRVTLSPPKSNPKIFFVHRLVAYTYMLKPENKTEINHIDGNKLNNHIFNLEWVTSSENQKHAFKLGLQKSKSGKDNPMACSVINLNTKEIFATINDAAKSINRTNYAISNCCRGKSQTSGGFKWSYYAV